ncbi:MAG: glycosyltransferase [Anaerolineales bacterium]|nr:glycosyltransferase [Anaerolineales bacterium]
MNVLFLTPQLPYPPRQGTALRNFHLIEGLAQQHTISVLSFIESDQSTDRFDWGPLATLCKRIETVSIAQRSTAQRLRDMILTRQPDMALRLWNKSFANKLAEWLRDEKFDLVHIEGIEMAPFIPILKKAPVRPMIIFDDHNAEYVLQARAFQTDLRIPKRWHAAAYSLIQWIRLRRFETITCARSDRVIAVSETDRVALLKLDPNIQVDVIPNCIDTKAYAPKFEKTAPGFDLIFTGKMDFRPNVDAVFWFWKEIWPIIQSKMPDTTWGIVGKSPHGHLKQLADDPAISVVGEVPEIIPYLHAATVYVIPLRMGGGTRFKLMEAMAAGLPVVSTSIGSEGVPVRSGQDILLADSPADFAYNVMRLLQEPELRKTLSDSAIEMVRKEFDWRTVTQGLEKVYMGGIR